MANHNSAGFSLIELMITVVILSIAIALGIPSYRTWVQNTQVRNAAESIVNGMQLARGEAVKRNSSVAFTLNGAASAWTVSVVAGGAVIETRGAGEGSKNVELTILPLGATTITFNNFGAADNDPNNLTQIDLTSPLLAPGDKRDLRITIGIGGSVRMCDPDPMLAASDPRKC